MLFIHTPKCGGSYVGRVFSPYWRRCISLRAPELAGHLTYEKYCQRLKEIGQPIDTFQTFSVVRNPFDWHVSWFSYIRGEKGGKRSGYLLEHDLFQKMSFSDYVDWLNDPDADRTPQFDMGKSLWQWVSDEPCITKVERVLRQETLYSDLRNLVEELGLRVKIPRGPVNASDRSDYRRYYSACDVDKIANRHAVDCRMFNYKFDG